MDTWIAPMASSTSGKIVGTAERNDFYWFHSSTFGRNKGCLPFTWAKRSVQGLGKWWAKLRTGKFHPGSRICHLYKSVPSTEKTVTKAWNWYQTWLWANGTQISVWNITSGKNRTTFSDVPLLPEIFRWIHPKGRVTFTFQQDIPETFCE